MAQGSILDLSLTFDSGVVTALHDSRIPDGALASASNAVFKDGTMRMDQRYRSLLAIGASPQGSAWAKWQGTSEYVLVSGQRAYAINANDPSSAASLSGATLSSGDWSFSQFRQYVYGVNASSNIARYSIGNHASWTLVAPPTAPGAVTTANPVTSYSFAFTSNPFTSTGTPTVVWSLGSWKATYAAAGTYVATMTLESGMPKDWSYRDIFAMTIRIPTGTALPEMTVHFAAGDTGVQAILWMGLPIGASAGYTTYHVYYRMQNISRASRISVHSLSWQYTLQTTSKYIQIYIGAPGYTNSWISTGVWLSVDSSMNPGSSLPTLQALVYEATFYDSSTGLESTPSAQTVVQAFSQHTTSGDAVTLSVAASGSWSHVRFYRVVTSGGLTTRYLLGQVANSGTPTVVDYWPLDEIVTKPIYLPSSNPSGASAICAWQNRLVLAVGSLVQISKSAISDGDELKFEPLSGAYDPYNPARGLTFYPDDTQSEVVYGLGGGYDLYIITDRSVRAIIGNSPDNWRLIKLPESEGAVGRRSWCLWKNGVIVLTPSGRLLYLSTSGADAVEMSAKMRKRIGNEGFAKYATSDAVVGVRPDGEIEVRNREGYAILDTNGNFRTGEFTDQTHSMLYVTGYPIRWIGSNGKLYEGGNDAYTDDDGVPVAWSATTKKFLFPTRMQATNIAFGDSVQSKLPDGSSVPYPKLVVIGERGEVDFNPRAGRETLKNVQGRHDAIGDGLQFRLEGDADTVIERCVITLEARSRGQNL